MEKQLVNQEYWDNSYDTLDIDIDITRDPLAGFLRNILEKYGTKGSSVMEVGCYPGRYLKVFGEFGYQLNGIDLTPRVKTDLPEFFAKKGYTLGSFRQANFFDHNYKESFDVVCSFGFIEHFSNWQEVLLKHYEMVNKGGLLIITVPNFSGVVQFLLHKYLDNINLGRHNIKAMDITSWMKLLKKKSLNFDNLYAGYFGNFDFWAEHQELGKFKKKVLNFTLFLKDKIKDVKLPYSKHYSPYMGIVIRKK